MSKEKMAASPTRFSGELDHFFDPNFTEEIIQKMQVPKRIKVNGENEDDVVIGVGGAQPAHHAAWESEKIAMHVPDRILVVDRPEASTSRSERTSRHPSRKGSEANFSLENWHISPTSFRVTAMTRSDGPLSPFSRPLSRKKSSMSTRTMRSHKSCSSGQEQLFGTRGTPLEASHENAVLQSETPFVRVQTPPRVITLSDHYFPSADDLPPPMLDETPPTGGFVRPKGRTGIDAEGDHRTELNSLRSMDAKNESFASSDRYRMQPIIPYRDGTPSLTEGMSTNEEIAHLRRQLAKLNRRVMSIELENLQRQQCEKIVYMVGIAYIFWKTLIWLRSS